MKIKSGKEEIVYLLNKVVEKHEQVTGRKMNLNTNRKNYEDIAKLLSQISNELPHTAGQLHHSNYAPHLNQQSLEYPYRKYDITGGQIKDAFSGIVTSPRAFLVDACYIYLYGVGRKGFEENPVDDALVVTQHALPDEVAMLKLQAASANLEKEKLVAESGARFLRLKKIFSIILFLSFALMALAVYKWLSEKNGNDTIKQDLSILPYQATRAEIDSLEGVWLCYTGSPQARGSDPNRYHLVVSNVVQLKYKNGYFTYTRYGASFNHTGYAQFEAPGLVMLHSHIKNNSGTIESPRYSLMQLEKSASFLPVISASWSFDVGDKNKIIGIREVYTKLGKGGSLEEVINTVENASCKCKIIIWNLPGETAKTIQIKNQPIDSLQHTALKSLLNEKSIILRVPQEGLILSADSVGGH